MPVTIGPRMRGHGARHATLAVVCSAVLTSVASCRSATEVVVDVRTNAAYRDGLVVSFTVGAPGDVETGAATTESRTPWGADGFVGSLTVVPRSGSNKDASLGVKIVLGIDRDSRSCAPPDYSGCIVARRRIVYSPHERLELPIALYVQCKDVACDAASTCNVLGQCVSATVDPATCSGAHGCNISGDPQASTPPAPADGGRVDGASDATTSDAPIDAPRPADAAVDAPPDGMPGPGTAGIVDCGPGLTCDLTGSFCCFDPLAQTGHCTPQGTSCGQSQMVLRVVCDGTEDCAAGGTCCATGTGAQCAPAGDCAGFAEVCHSTHTCKTGACLDRSFAAGYYETCQ